MTGAERSAKHRKLRRKCRAVYPVPMRDEGLSVLVAARFLAEHEAADREAIGRAIAQFLEPQLDRLRDQIISERVSSGML
jgi:hypothetical protein